MQQNAINLDSCLGLACVFTLIFIGLTVNLGLYRIANLKRELGQDVSRWPYYDPNGVMMLVVILSFIIALASGVLGHKIHGTHTAELAWALSGLILIEVGLFWFIRRNLGPLRTRYNFRKKFEGGPPKARPPVRHHDA